MNNINLTGSKKQITWATDIINGLVQACESGIKHSRELAEQMKGTDEFSRRVELYEKLLDDIQIAVQHQTKASFYIDHYANVSVHRMVDDEINRQNSIRRATILKLFGGNK